MPDDFNLISDGKYISKVPVVCAIPFFGVTLMLYVVKAPVMMGVVGLAMANAEN